MRTLATGALNPSLLSDPTLLQEPPVINHPVLSLPGQRDQRQDTEAVHEFGVASRSARPFHGTLYYVYVLALTQ